jgi:hypothetical protein
MAECDRWADHQLPNGKSWVIPGACLHGTAERMSRAEFRRLPHVKCVKPGCGQTLGVICPDCRKVY